MKQAAFVLSLMAAAGCAGLTDSSSAGPASIGVTGGAPETSDTFAAVVALTNPGGPFCSGTLVSKRVVVTAAHCLDDTDLAEVQVVFGDTVAQGTAVDVLAGLQHPYYSRTNIPWNDVAVLRLARDVSTAPANVFDQRPRREDFATDLHLLGFGYTELTRRDPGIKRHATARLQYLQDRELTHTPIDGGLCYGDSGGPTFIETDGIYYFVGVHSRISTTACAGATGTDARVDAHWTGFIVPYINQWGGGTDEAGQPAGGAGGGAGGNPISTEDDDGSADDDASCPEEWRHDEVCDECLGDDPDCAASDPGATDDCPAEWRGDGFCDECLGDDPDCEPSAE